MERLRHIGRSNPTAHTQNTSLATIKKYYTKSQYGQTVEKYNKEMLTNTILIKKSLQNDVNKVNIAAFQGFSTGEKFLPMRVEFVTFRGEL